MTYGPFPCMQCKLRMQCTIHKLQLYHIIIPYSFEKSITLGQAALDFVSDLGQRLHQVTGEARSKEYLLQKLSIAIQRGNAAAVLGTAEKDRDQDPFWD